MTKIIEKKYCTGCEACLNVCSHAAIIMERDSEGFDYPSIDGGKCVECGLCTKVCPVLHYEETADYRKEYNDVQKAVAAKTNREEWRQISSSGGIFPVVANYILEQNGMVVGAAFDGCFDVHHIIIDNKNDLFKVQASKYAQSRIGNIYKEIKKYLADGKLVLFAGMACQVEGLKSFLRKEYSNLYTIDLICMGIPSPGVWRSYLDTTFHGEKIKFVNFKDKTYGWRTFSLCVETDQRSFLQKGFDNAFFQCMFKTYSLRPSCFNCPFKKEERLSDFTLADCWGTVEEVPHLDDNKGLSSVIIHSSKGWRLWKKLASLVDTKEVALASIVVHNENLVRNRQCSSYRHEFYKLFVHSPRQAFIRYGRNPKNGKWRRLKLLVKRVLKK
ncbi:NAD(P)H-quinone oxidoreductase subunit I, chloroplastic [Bacteroidaceae bacterium]|uniref:Coenzyme F420 hydrogenase/dehydrogenase, beta subunit C-terminal domain n=1 Tax=uncultured Phocaeicola sp. TaxID=990718 RepID=UPI000E8650FC|nr:Coenzyme F420 hydrogenase/dehydrogenase, beta subunit C-terminal domain [uncultured Phocaeicola sp.]GFH99801.1 NAD(P)H-quinone oxidoreductase subunit I, chloroplastic [Bacteroidaceae bacterium]HBV82518.1 hypothetical protein [Lachnospiraceae bacterium]